MDRIAALSKTLPGQTQGWDEKHVSAGVRGAAPPAAASVQPQINGGKLGLWLLIASEIVIFAGLLGSFILFRMAHPEWAGEAAHLNLGLGTANTLILLASNFLMMKASAAAGEKRLEDSRFFMFWTMVFGALFLGVKACEYALEAGHGETPSAGNFWSFYFLMTGIHGLHILGGILAIGLLWWKGVRGTLGPAANRVALTGLYWSFVEVVWIFLFPLLYLLS